MNIRICWLLLCILILSAPSICVAGPVASVDVVFNGSINKIIPSVIFDASIRQGSNYSDYSDDIFNVLLDNSSIGDNFTVFPTDPGFNSFLSYLKDDTKGYVLLKFGSTADSQVKFSGTIWENNFPNLQNVEISSINLKVNNFNLDSSSELWTDYHCNFTFSLETPEPCTIASLLLGALIIRKKTK